VCVNIRHEKERQRKTRNDRGDGKTKKIEGSNLFSLRKRSVESRKTRIRQIEVCTPRTVRERRGNEGGGRLGAKRGFARDATVRDEIRETDDEGEKERDGVGGGVYAAFDAQALCKIAGLVGWRSR